MRIGININQTRFHKSLPNPVSLQQITGREYDVIELAGVLYELVMKRIATMTIIPTEKTAKEYNKRLYKLNETVKLKKASAVFKTTIKSVSLQGQLHTVDAMERQFDFGEVQWII